MRSTRQMFSHVLLFIMATVIALGQVYTGTISGTVKDPSGAVVPNANITVTDAAKGFTYHAASNNSGLFSVKNLPPGTYTERVEVTGFNPSERSNIVIEVAGNVNGDVTLQVASAGQSVTVSEASAPMLQTDDATTGQTLNRTFINDLPLINRAVYDLAFLAPGVSQATGTAYGAGNGIGNNFVSDGERNAQSDILIDGISSTTYEQNTGFVTPLYTPSVDAVQEFRVQQTNFSAEIGFSAGTVVNVVTRSGSNQFHGSAYEFFRNTDLNANDFFSNANGSARPAYHWNDFGGTIGGPIKKDKLFFFFDYEGNRTVTPSATHVGVPSAAERTGNFGELCGNAGGTFNASGVCSAASGQLWDPWSAVPDSAPPVNNGSGGLRTTYIPFNNLGTYASSAAGLPSYINPGVAGNLINPVSAKIIQNFPLPNGGGTPGTTSYNPYNNFYGTASNPGHSNQYDIKVDARATDMDQLSVRFSSQLTGGLGGGGNIFGNVWDANTQGPTTSIVYSTSLNYTHTFNPTTLLTATVGYDHSWAHTSGIAAQYPDFKATDYGFPSNITASGFVAPPAITLSNYAAENGNANIGGQPWSGLLYGRDVYHMLASVAHTAGNHDIHVGAEYRVHRINFQQFGVPAGLFNFTPSGTSQFGSTGGDSVASFLTGAATGWSAYELPPAPATQNLQYAGFIQDNWHVNGRLTLNLGLRYDVDSPRTERYNQMSFFDPSAPSPIAGLVPASACPTCANTNLGSVEYVGQNGYGRSPYKPFYGAIGPRFGFGYRFFKDTTIRGGYGIYYDPSKYGAAGTGSGGAGFLGYDSQTSFTNWTGPSNSLPALVLGQPLNINPVTGNKFGTATNLGGNVGGIPVYADGFDKLPQEQSWSFGIEHQLPGNILIDAEYVGRAGHHLYLGGDTNALNHLPVFEAQAFQTNASAQNATVPIPAALAAAVQKVTPSFSNPYWGGNWQVYDQYYPYPQFAGGSTLWGNSGLSNVDPPFANSIYNSFQFKAEKRFSHGLQALFTYTFQKSIDDSSIAGSNVYINGTSGGTLSPATQDPNNISLERSISQFNIPQILQFSWVYQLPFGRGKTFGGNWNRAVDAVLGGWQINGVYRWDDGLPLILYLNNGTNVPTYGPQRPNLPTDLQQSGTVGPNANYFSNAAGAAADKGAPITQANGNTCYASAWYPCQYFDGTAPRVLPKNRAPGTNNVTASLFKQFPLWNEASKLEFGVEAFNLFNHVQFQAPSTTVGQSNFGMITNQANSPRELQLRAKLYF